MVNRTGKDTITISEKTIRKGVVILPLREYQKLYERAVPTYYLKGKAAKKLDKLVEEGLREYREGKTVIASSLKDALRIYGRKKNKKN